MAAVQPSRSRQAPPRGRIDKQQAIVTAALTVFARMGYAQARVDDIAAEARVAKATVYNHFGDKETLFRQVVQSLSGTALTANLAAIEQLARSDDAPAAPLTEVGFQLVKCYCTEESRALRRFVCAEAAQFPDLVDLVTEVSHQAIQTLADRLARLALAGTLRIDDPETAAVQFTALLTGPAESLSRLGTRSVPDAALHTLTQSAVTTFLRAFGK